MSLWNWIIDWIIGPAGGEPHREAPRSTDEDGGGVAVATLPDAEETIPWFEPEGATLLEPAPIETRDLTHEGAAVERMLLNHLDGCGLSLMPMPRVPEAVLRLLADPECRFAEVAEVISQDQASATRVLRAANCWVRGIEQITSLPHAVARLGVTAVRTIMMSETLRAATFMKEIRNRPAAQMLWHRAIASGHIMRALAPHVYLDPEDAFVIGLLHDLGNVIVLSVVGKYEGLSHDQFEAETFEYLCLRYHQEFGGLLAKEWELPSRLRKLIESHHTYPSADDMLRRERLTLMLTDMITQMLGYAPPESYNLLESRPLTDLKLVAGPDLLATFTRLPGEIEESLSYF